MIRRNKFFKRINWRIRFTTLIAIGVMVLSGILFWSLGIHGEVIDPKINP